jgi:hypothetical protein
MKKLYSFFLNLNFQKNGGGESVLSVSFFGAPAVPRSNAFLILFIIGYFISEISQMKIMFVSVSSYSHKQDTKNGWLCVHRVFVGG